MESNSITHTFSLGGSKAYLTCMVNPEGELTELHIKVDKRGSLLSGLGVTTTSLINLCLTYKIPLVEVINKLQYHKFEPSGLTKNPNIPLAGSLSDYLAQYLKLKFVKEEEGTESV